MRRGRRVPRIPASHSTAKGLASAGSGSKHRGPIGTPWPEGCQEQISAAPAAPEPTAPWTKAYTPLRVGGSVQRFPWEERGRWSKCLCLTLWHSGKLPGALISSSLDCGADKVHPLSLTFSFSERRGRVEAFLFKCKCYQLWISNTQWLPWFTLIRNTQWRKFRETPLSLSWAPLELHASSSFTVCRSCSGDSFIPNIGNLSLLFLIILI